MLKFFYQFFYDIIWHLFLLIYFIIYYLFAKKNKDRKKSLCDRLSIYNTLENRNNKVLWFHGSSLGEVLSLLPLMKFLKQKFSQTQILSTSTIRGQYVAQEKSKAERIIYLPFDISYLIRSALKKNKPDALIIFETEIWPNLFWECSRAKIPLIIVSGRISKRSFPKYKLAKFFFDTVLKDCIFLMQTQEDIDRIIKMGAPETKVKLCGDIKLDGLKTKLTISEKEFLNNTFNIDETTIVAGSTHHGEEEIIVKVFEKLQKKWPKINLIIAPRHLKRIKDIQHWLNKNNYKYMLRSKLPDSKPEKIILLDTYGELSIIYYLAKIVFIGGTITPVGGHNLLEPAAFGKPVLFGKHIDNCKKQAQLLLNNNAGKIILTEDELEKSIDYLLSNPHKIEEMGNQSKNIITTNQGALNKSINEIEKILGTASNYPSLQ